MGIEKVIQNENGQDRFQVRLLQDDGVGLLTDQSGNNYLILDSLDYWYDLIQERYPAKLKCGCKNHWFKAVFHYEYHEHFPDIREVQVFTICASCGKMAKRMAVNIDYSPTEQLIEQPITHCEKPNIKYKVSELTALWTGTDREQVLRFLMVDLGLMAYYVYFKKPENVRVFEPMSLNRAFEQADCFLEAFFVKGQPMNAVEMEDEGGISIDKNFWRKQEAIRLYSINIRGLGLMYFIEYCNQHIDKGEVKDKSAEFEEITSRLKVWLGETFTSNRGKNCFDGEKGYQKYLLQQK